MDHPPLPPFTYGHFTGEVTSRTFPRDGHALYTVCIEIPPDAHPLPVGHPTRNPDCLYEADICVHVGTKFPIGIGTTVAIEVDHADDGQPFISSIKPDRKATPIGLHAGHAVPDPRGGHTYDGHTGH